MKVSILGVEHDLDPSKLKFGEAVQLEKLTGRTFTEFGDLLAKGSMEMLQAFALVLHKRSAPQARLADIEQMSMADLKFIPEEGDTDAGDAVKQAKFRKQADPTKAAS